MIRVQLPFHLQTLAASEREVRVDVRDGTTVSVLSVVRALEASYPMLKGAVIDHNSDVRRPKIRFFACQQDFSLQPLECELPVAVREGEEALIIIGAISGG